MVLLYIISIEYWTKKIRIKIPRQMAANQSKKVDRQFQSEENHPHRNASKIISVRRSHLPVVCSSTMIHKSQDTP